MLDLHRNERRLTQGRPVGSMVVARQPAEDVPVAETVSSPQISAEDRGPAPSELADEHALAQRVYQLLQQDIAVERERFGRRS